MIELQSSSHLYSNLLHLGLVQLVWLLHSCLPPTLLAFVKDAAGLGSSMITHASVWTVLTSLWTVLTSLWTVLTSLWTTMQ